MEASLLACPAILGCRVAPSACCSVSGSEPLCSGVWGKKSLYAAALWCHGRKQWGPQNGHKCASPGLARAYMETPKSPVVNFFHKVQGNLPIVGLIARILSDEGGVGTDRLQFVEFCTKVEKKMSREGSRALYAFAERHGKVAKAPYVLIWCWAAAVGAGLLKSEELLLGAARLRVSYDMQYEVETFELLMDEAAKKRAKTKSPAPKVPMAARAEKALQAISRCCIGTELLSEEDAVLLSTILCNVFPTVEADEIEKLVRVRVTSNAQAESQNVASPLPQ